MRKTLLTLMFLLTCLVGSTVGCGRATDKEEQRRQPTRENEEWVDEMFGEIGDENRQIIRKLAQEYVHAQISAATVQGVSTTLFTGNLYLVAVDAVKDDRRLTFDLVARRFYPLDEAKEPYWVVDPLDRRLSLALSGLALKKLEREKEAGAEP